MSAESALPADAALMGSHTVRSAHTVAMPAQVLLRRNGVQPPSVWA